MSHRLTKVASVVVFALAAIAGSAQAMAGTAGSAGKNASLSVSDSGGYSWNVDLGNTLQLNAATGAVSLSSVLPTDDAQGGWAWNTGYQYTDAKSGATSTVTAMQWHSWTTVSGGDASSFSSSNPWRTSFTFFAAGDVDPFMSYGFTAKNNSNATQTYIYNQGESIVPTVSGSYVVNYDISAAFSNPTGSIAFNPTSPGGVQVLQLSGDGGNSYVSAGVDVGAAFNSNTTGALTGYNYSASTYGSGSYDYWLVTTQFTLSGQKDVASVAGYMEITPVPEPKEYAMMFAGFGLVALMVRRQFSV